MDWDLTGTQLVTIRRLKRGLQELGYVGSLLREDYEFADFLADSYSVNKIPIATFAQEPPSYRNASFGVAVANGQSGVTLVNRYKSLGAPQILEIHGDKVLRWRVNGRSGPRFLESIETDHLPEFFVRHATDFSPQRVLQAKTSEWDARQLDFLDLGLLPLLEKEMRTKLDLLLHETVKSGIQSFEQREPFGDQHYLPLFRLIFRLMAAKVLADRQHPGNWAETDPAKVIQSVENFYFQDSTPPPVISQAETQAEIWDRIRGSFHFQNLSVESLAFIYENTLVTPERRSSLGIHSSPPAVAEFMVKNLPFEALPVDERRVFEPFAGHSVFLVAAMKRLRELLAPGMNHRKRHDYFVKMLSGIELDGFALEVARLSLMLADYPNPDGWRLYQEDAFDSSRFDAELNDANVLLCNPPFERFDENERVRYEGLKSSSKPVEVLHRVLQRPPKLLGFVLPRVFAVGREYRDLRSRLAEAYSSIELVTLPDGVFQHSEAETVVLLCHGEPAGNTARLKVGQVGAWRRGNLTELRPTISFDEIISNPRETFGKSMYRPSLQEVWNATAKFAVLGDVATIHRGIEYNVPLRENLSDLTVVEQRDGFVPGLLQAKGAIEPFVVVRPTYLSNSPEKMRTSAFKLPWHKTKLIANAHAMSRGHWRLIASLDASGLMCYQNFHGIWSNAEYPIEILAAILNGPLANAFISTREDKRSVKVSTLKSIPIPDLKDVRQIRVKRLVEEYIATRIHWMQGGLNQKMGAKLCIALQAAIDGEILEAYNLTPDVEYELLRSFKGHRRVGELGSTDLRDSQYTNIANWREYSQMVLNRLGEKLRPSMVAQFRSSVEENRRLYELLAR